MWRRFEQQLLASREEHVRQAEAEAQAVRRQLVRARFDELSLAVHGA